LKEEIRMKKSLVVLFLLMFSGSAYAALMTIGTATYNDSDYNLIWDPDNNGNSVIWLDYSNSQTTWDNQVSWADDLNSNLTINQPQRVVLVIT